MSPLSLCLFPVNIPILSFIDHVLLLLLFLFFPDPFHKKLHLCLLFLLRNLNRSHPGQLQKWPVLHWFHRFLPRKSSVFCFCLIGSSSFQSNVSPLPGFLLSNTYPLILSFISYSSNFSTLEILNALKIGS